MLVALSALTLLLVLAQLRCVVLTVLGVRLRGRTIDRPADPDIWPRVLVQLPVYREEAVLDQLLRAVLALDYPRDRLIVQVVDDSSGPSQQMAAAIVRHHQGGPVRVEYVHRSTRHGYKAGAMNHGASVCASDLVAIFDADFVPDPRFLRETVPLFDRPEIAAVQARWTYRNGAASPLAVLQAAIFEAVFCFESQVRSRLGVSALFMGTAGVWRRSVIDAVGGWREVPFTAEDLDLSYRAVIARHLIAYQHEPLASCEASESYLAFKSQQRRWARGIFQAAIDNAAGVLRASQGNAARLLDASVLALQTSMPALLLLQVLTGVFVVLGLPRSPVWIAIQVVLAGSLLVPPAGIQLAIGQWLLHADWRCRVGKLARAFPLACGLSISVWAGLWDVVTRSRREFVRTPKQQAKGLLAGSQAGWLRSGKAGAASEALLAAWGVVATVAAAAGHYPEALPATALLAVGNLAACAASVRDVRAQTAHAASPVSRDPAPP